MIAQLCICFTPIQKTQEGNLPPPQTCLAAPHDCGHAMFLPPEILNGCPPLIFLTSPNCPACHLLLSSFKIVATDRLSGVTASCSQHHNKTRFQMRSRDENNQRMSHLLSSQEPAHLSADFQRTTATGGDRLTGNRCRDLIFAVGRRERRVATIVALSNSG